MPGEGIKTEAVFRENEIGKTVLGKEWEYRDGRMLHHRKCSILFCIANEPKTKVTEVFGYCIQS